MTTEQTPDEAKQKLIESLTLLQPWDTDELDASEIAIINARRASIAKRLQKNEDLEDMYDREVII
jgi:hypothetical protein